MFCGSNAADTIVLYKSLLRTRVKKKHRTGVLFLQQGIPPPLHLMSGVRGLHVLFVYCAPGLNQTWRPGPESSLPPLQTIPPSPADPPSLACRPALPPLQTLPPSPADPPSLAC